MRLMAGFFLTRCSFARHYTIHYTVRVDHSTGSR
jgi:hypothetical protein